VETSTSPTLEISLEDAGGTSWWASLLATLGSQSGNAYLRFVGLVDGEQRYTGATFAAPRTLGEVPPQDAWAPELTTTLDELCQEIEADGWILVGTGEQPWARRYRRAPAAGSRSG
jgi:hypothetical protein